MEEEFLIGRHLSFFLEEKKPLSGFIWLWKAKSSTFCPIPHCYAERLRKVEAGILSRTLIAGQGWTGTLGRGSCDLEKMEEKYYSRKKKKSQIQSVVRWGWRYRETSKMILVRNFPGSFKRIKSHVQYSVLPSLHSTKMPSVITKH